MWAEHFYQKGIALASYPYERQFASVKLLNYVGGVMAHQTVVKKHNAQDALFVSVNKPHYLLEGTTFNFSLVKDGVLYTHPFDGRVLAGITLTITGMLARRMGIPVKEERSPYESLKDADEAFITSSTRNVLPVVRVDDMVIGTGAPGKVTMLLMKSFDEYLACY
jgi:branched-subunit amino acid aminotransferase/4-amino-4-deoxychorismate lyase